jgi:predicted ATP-dependent endonuclease of OLD family
MGTLLKTLTIENYRSFYDPQTIVFAIPDSTKNGSGLSVIIGENNSGKSTILEALKKISDNSQFGRAERHANGNVKLTFENSRGEINIIETTGGSVPTKSNELIEPRQQRINFVLSRRYWQAQFPQGQITKNDYRSESYAFNKTSTDNSFGRRLIEIQSTASLKSEFNRLMLRVMPEFSDWNVDLDGATNFINYTTKNGAQHDSDLFGDGVPSLFRIFVLLIDASPDDVLTIDEPELSLHPQAQKKVAKIISEYSKNLQIILITHSTHFVNWDDLKNGAKITRLFKKGDLKTTTHRLNSTADYYEKLFTFSELWQQPQLLDSVAKELFFSTNVLFVEGQEDVGLLNKFIKENGIEINFDIFGYGVGGAGNIIFLLEMAIDLGITVAAIYDGDKNVDASEAKKKFDNIFIDVINADDIRDKHRKDPTNCKKDLPEIEKLGLFNNSGKIKPEQKDYLADLVKTINSYFCNPN